MVTTKSGFEIRLAILLGHRLPQHTGLCVNPIPLGDLRSRNIHLKPINDLEPEFLVHGDRDVGALQIDGQPVCRSQLENFAGEEGAGTLTLACRVRANEAQAWAGSRLARGSVSSGPGGEKIGAPTPAGRAEDWPFAAHITTRSNGREMGYDVFDGTYDSKAGPQSISSWRPRQAPHIHQGIRAGTPPSTAARRSRA